MLFSFRALSESVFLEVLREKKMGVHVTNVYPGQTNTDMFAGVSHRSVLGHSAFGRAQRCGQT